MFRHKDNTSRVYMSLIWVPKGHVALASAVLEGTLTECGPINRFLCVDNNSSSEFDDLHGQLLSTSTSHSRRESESESPEYFMVTHIARV